MTVQTAATTLTAVVLLSCSGERGSAPVSSPRASAATAALLIGSDELGSDPARAADLEAQLVQDLYTYFRFINKRWSKAVCASFGEADFESVVTSLHGDAHFSQYALTNDQRGLDDFDDSASGPAALDIVRFLASVELVLTAKAWDAERERAFDAFFDAYRRAVVDPTYMPAEPAYVSRSRARLMSQEEFLVWAESLMEPFDEHASHAHAEGARRFAEAMLRSRPDLPAHYFDVKRSGWLHIGVGSALTLKQLARMEGPTTAPEDDIVLEAKELSDLSGIDCVETTSDDNDATRVLDGSRRVGRIRHDIMAILPPLPGQKLESRNWWVRSWAPSYTEIDLADLRSADELVEIVRDVGAQLGHGHRAEARETPDLASERLDRNEAWARREAAAQVLHLREAWAIFRESVTG